LLPAAACGIIPGLQGGVNVAEGGTLQGMRVLVTGGTGSIGQAMCRVFAREGADLAFTWNRREAEARALEVELTALGRRVLHGQVGASDGPAVQAFCDRVEAGWGGVDALVNALGGTQVLPFALIDEPDWDETLALNLKPMFLFSKAVARGMIRRKAGVILNLGSLAGRRMLEVPVHYATAKAGVTGFTISLAKELARYGIRVLELTPGLIKGGIGDNVSERQLAEYNRYCALGRPGTATEVAELAAFLISPRAGYMNAISVQIDGGL
jgi:3-oxoacyl-[acyl-carrier protein] reductase